MNRTDKDSSESKARYTDGNDRDASVSGRIGSPDSAVSDSREDARTLVDRLDVPHSTVQRNLSKLEERGWVDVTVNRRYDTTPVGKMVFDGLDGLLGTAQSMDGLATFIDCVPFGEFGIELDVLADAECVVADADTPAAPLNEFVELLAGSEGFTLLTPHWNPAYSDVIDRQLDAGNDVRLITTGSQRSLLTGSGVGAIEEQPHDEQLTVALTDETLPFGLARVGEQIALVAYRDGAVRVLVESDDPAVVEWATQYLHDTDATAAPLRPQVQ